MIRKEDACLVLKAIDNLLHSTSPKMTSEDKITEKVNKIDKTVKLDRERTIEILKYLEDKGFIEARFAEGGMKTLGATVTRITAHGYDFMEENCI